MKILGATIAISPETDINQFGDKFEIIGTKDEILKNHLTHRITPNEFIDYTDLSKDHVEVEESFLSFVKKFNIPDNYIYISAGKFSAFTIYMDYIPKSATLEPVFKDFFEKIDTSKSDFICNEFGVAVNFNGFNYYNLSNFNIKESVFYLVKHSTKKRYYVNITDRDINVQNLINNNKKADLYELIKSKNIILLKTVL